MLFKPATRLVEEILDKETTRYSGFTGFIIWVGLGTIMSPYILLYLLNNDNDKTIQNMAATLANRIIEDEE